jgi:hypothetical protein
METQKMVNFQIVINDFVGLTPTHGLIEMFGALLIVDLETQKMVKFEVDQV